MAREDRENIIIGLDIGTTKVCCIIAKPLATGIMDVIGVSSIPCRGIKKGAVVDLENTQECIAKAVSEAERMAGIQVSSVHVGVTGEHIKGTNSRGMIIVSGGDKEIREEDKWRVIEGARTITIPPNQEVIHVIPQEYIVDDQAGIKDPLGMTGVRLEARVHIITALQPTLQNIIKSVNRAGFAVESVILQPLAAAEAVLTADEKELGVVLADIGGGTTDLAMYFEGALQFTSILGIGGIQVTSDVAVGLQTSSYQQAEEIKKKQGCAMVSLTQEGEEIAVSRVNGKSKVYARRFLAEIIEPRMEEIFDLIAREIERNDFRKHLVAGLVLTGGTCLLEGTEELGEKILNMPVRLGVPRNVGGLTDIVNSPLYATGVGLTLYGLNSKRGGEGGAITKKEEAKAISGFYKKAKKWLSDYF